MSVTRRRLSTTVWLPASGTGNSALRARGVNSLTASLTRKFCVGSIGPSIEDEARRVKKESGPEASLGCELVKRLLVAALPAFCSEGSRCSISLVALVALDLFPHNSHFSTVL